jgi:hypothetical protein
LRERLGGYEALSSSPNRHTARFSDFDLLASQQWLSDVTARAKSV